MFYFNNAVLTLVGSVNVVFLQHRTQLNIYC